MTIACAKETIVRKFTNYRNKHKNEDEDLLRHHEMSEKMLVAAAALVDLKAYSKGKRLFRKRMYDGIAASRDTLLKHNSNLSHIGAFQKALKQMWDAEDHDYWEAQAAGDPEDVYEYVLYFIIYLKFELTTI